MALEAATQLVTSSMNYLALARKYRPRTFSQLIGQEHINKALTNALAQQRLHHAYLFTGTRGVGKTSVARILSKALNCEVGISAEPCLTCDACTAIEQGRFIDLIEIDGASKTRVEDTRELLDNVPYAPTSGRFKIYLIDEVHMLSSHSFNALLKTLEEPPSHVKFILATTDPQKVPVTVLSRCLQFHLRHISAELINEHIQQILKDEKLDFEVRALEILAQAAQGSMRDALSLLDQAITSCDQKLYERDVKLLLGYTQHDYALLLLQALAEQNPNQLLELVQKINTEGGHFHYVLNELLTFLHHMTVYQSVGDNNPFVSPSVEISSLTKQFSAEDIQLFYQIALKGSEEIHLAPTLSIGFSMTMLRMLIFRPTKTATFPLANVKQNEPIQKDTPKIQEIDALPIQEECISSSENEVIDNSVPTIISEQDTPWANLIPMLQLTGLSLNAVENAEFISKLDQEITLAVAKGHQSLFTPTTIKRIETALAAYYKHPIKLNFSNEIITGTSPAQQRIQATAQKQQMAEEALMEDQHFLKIKQDFSAELVKNSIIPLKNDI